MQRLVGLKSKKSEDVADPVGNLNKIVTKLDSRAEEKEQRISSINEELRQCREQLKRMREGGPRDAVRQKAARLLAQRRRYEQQSEVLRRQAFNMEQAASGVETASEVRDTIAAVKEGTKVMKRELKKTSLEQVDDLQDDLADLLEMTDEVNEALGQSSYDTPPLDDAELEAELDALGEELAADEDTTFLDEAFKPSAPLPEPLLTGKEPSRQPVPVLYPQVRQDSDEYGLPRVPDHPF